MNTKENVTTMAKQLLWSGIWSIVIGNTILIFAIPESLLWTITGGCILAGGTLQITLARFGQLLIALAQEHQAALKKMKEIDEPDEEESEASVDTPESDPFKEIDIRIKKL